MKSLSRLYNVEINVHVASWLPSRRPFAVLYYLSKEEEAEEEGKQRKKSTDVTDKTAV